MINGKDVTVSCPGESPFGLGLQSIEKAMMYRGLLWLEERWGREKTIKRALELSYNSIASIPGGISLQQKVKKEPELTVGDMLDAYEFQKACETDHIVSLRFDPNYTLQTFYKRVDHGQKETHPCPLCQGAFDPYRPRDTGLMQKLQEHALHHGVGRGDPDAALSGLRGHLSCDLRTQRADWGRAGGRAQAADQLDPAEHGDAG